MCKRSGQVVIHLPLQMWPWLKTLPLHWQETLLSFVSLHPGTGKTAKLHCINPAVDEHPILKGVPDIFLVISCYGTGISSSLKGHLPCIQIIQT